MKVDRAVERRGWLAGFDRAPMWASVIAVSVLLAVVWVLVLGSGSDISTLRHLFYLPIVLAATQFGMAAGGAVGVLATLLAGPLSGPSDPGVWVGRGAAFVLVGLLIGSLVAARAENLRVATDVSEREGALVAQRAALVQVVSHELRTPLTILRGSMETLVEREVMVDPTGRELVRAMDRSVTRLQEMIDVVLAAADELDIETSAVSSVDVGALVQHAAGSLQPRLRQRLKLDIPADAALNTVESDLWLTLRCLLDNADKFSPEDGVVKVSFYEDDGLAVICVEDEGPGLPEGFGDRAFEPFHQADLSERRVHPGLGMGLYTARRLARRMGGDVVISSGELRGSRALIKLPAAMQPALVAPERR